MLEDTKVADGHQVGIITAGAVTAAPSMRSFVMAEPIVLRAPGTRSPLPPAAEWDGLMAELAVRHEVSVPTGGDLADLDRALPDWGVLALLVPGAAVVLCPFTTLVNPAGGAPIGHEVLGRMLAADIGAPTVVTTHDSGGAPVTVGHAVQLHPAGHLLYSDALAWEREDHTLVAISTTDQPGLSDAMPNILLRLTEGPTDPTDPANLANPADLTDPAGLSGGTAPANGDLFPTESD